MSESIPTTWNTERDTAFFGITKALAADGFADDTAEFTTAAFVGGGLTAQIDKILDDLTVAESWEAMAARAIDRTTRHERDLVPVPVGAPRR